jgi:hypothetical protein
VTGPDPAAATHDPAAGRGRGAEPARDAAVGARRSGAGRPARDPGVGARLGGAGRPTISTPLRLQSRPARAAQRERWARQPGLGALGLLLVLPVAVLLAFAADGPETSLLLLAPLATFGLPVVAMVAFWWDDWPGTTLRSSWSGWADTVLVIVSAVGLTLLGTAVVRGVGAGAAFDPTPVGRPTFPATMALAGTAFVAMLQLTLVCEGWPLRGRLGQTGDGLAALAVAWVAALLVQAFVLDDLLAGPELGALLTLIGAWQVVLFVLWRGWPVSRSSRRALRLVGGNALVLGGAALTYAATRGLDPGAVSAAGGCVVAAGLLYGMLFEGFLRDRIPARAARAALLALTAVTAVVLDLGLGAYADTVEWIRATPDDWVIHASLNAIGVGIILHVAIGRRWPFGRTAARPSAEPVGKSLRSA